MKQLFMGVLNNEGSDMQTDCKNNNKRRILFYKITFTLKRGVFENNNNYVSNVLIS